MDLLTLATALEAPPRQRRNVKLALLAVAGVTALDIIGARALSAQQSRERAPKDMRGRTGFPGGVAAARGGAKDFTTPPDMRAGFAVVR